MLLAYTPYPGLGLEPRIWPERHRHYVDTRPQPQQLQRAGWRNGTFVVSPRIRLRGRCQTGTRIALSKFAFGPFFRTGQFN